MYTMEWLNEANTKQFTEVLGEIFEKSPWVAIEAASARPFPSKQALYDYMAEVVKKTDINCQLELINNHPSLGERVQMSDYSTNEQQQAGLQGLNGQEYENFIQANEAYMKKFGFPFIIAVRGKNKHEIYEAMLNRLAHDCNEEFQTALAQVYQIAKLRIEERII